MKWISFKGATVPPQTRDGRKWGGDLGRGTPDPYAVLLVNGSVLIKTPVQSNTLEPTWPSGPAGNFRVKETDRFRIELWDSKTVNDHPIGIKDMGPLSEEVQHLKEADLECDTGAQVRVAFEPPHARMGLGLHYELRVGEAYVTRVYEESPAGRAGLKAGDQILSLEGRDVSAMKSLEVQSSLNTPHVEGLAMKVRHRGGEELAVTLKDGPIYPLFAEIGTLR